MTTTALPSPIEGLQAILEPGQVTELRAFVENRRGFVETWSGYYTDLNALLEDAAKLDEMGASGVYYVPNAITPDALARREPNTCRVMRKADATTSDRDITGRRWLLQDLDPKRTKGVSATDSEKELAGEVMGRLCDLLESVGLPEPVTADSGNGFHVMLPIDLPADDGGLCKALTDALADTFTTDAVEVDRAVHNASRIWKLPGTTARKGYATEERPHRTASFLVVPEITRRASEDDLRRALASLRADVPDEAPRPAEAKPGRLVVGDSVPFVADGPPASEEVPHVLSFFETRPDYETWTKIIAGVLDRCVGDVHEAERYLVTAFPEEVEGEYRKKLASPRDAGWPLVVHMAKERGYDPSAYYRDWLRENGAKRTNGKAYAAEPADAAPEPEDGPALTDFYWLATDNKCIFAPTGELWPNASADRRLPAVPTGQMKKGSDEPETIAASMWLASNRPVEQQTWAPGEPQIIEDILVAGAGQIPKPGVRVFNLYKPPILKLGNADMAGRWIEHLHTVYPDDADHITAWCASKVQRPGVKVNHALVLGGAPGIGKDTLLEALKRAVGGHNFGDATPTEVVSRFNGFLKSVVLRISEARDMGDVDRYGLYEHLKIITAAPPDVLRIDEKHTREFYIQNVVGIVYTTNHKSSGIYLPADDRRHYVAWSEATQGTFPESYWRDYYRWYESGGYGHVAAYLHEYDLSGFDPKAPPPKTTAFWEIVDANKAPEDAELADALDALDWPEAVTLQMVREKASVGFEEWLADRRNARKVPHRFEAAGYVPVRNEAAKDGRFKVGGKRQTIYARKDMGTRDRIIAAEALTTADAIPF